MSGQSRRISPELITPAMFNRADPVRESAQHCGASIRNLSLFGTSRILEMFSPW
jgi:hypothetical protein